VYSARKKLAQTDEGMGGRRERTGIVRGGWGGRPVGEEELLSPQLEASIGGDNPQDWGQVVC